MIFDVVDDIPNSKCERIAEECVRVGSNRMTTTRIKLENA